MDKIDDLIKYVPFITNLFKSIEVTEIKLEKYGITITRNIYESIVAKDKSSQRTLLKNIKNSNINIIHQIINNVNIENKVVINNIIEQLRFEGKKDSELKVIAKKLNDLNTEIKKKKPKWEKIMNIIKWSLTLGKDIFIQILPMLLKM